MLEKCEQKIIFSKSNDPLEKVLDKIQIDYHTVMTYFGESRHNQKNRVPLRQRPPPPHRYVAVYLAEWDDGSEVFDGVGGSNPRNSDDVENDVEDIEDDDLKLTGNLTRLTRLEWQFHSWIFCKEFKY